MQKHKWIFKFLSNGGRHLACKKCEAICNSGNIDKECNMKDNTGQWFAGDYAIYDGENSFIIKLTIPSRL